MCPSFGFKKFTQTDPSSFCVPAYPASPQGSRSLTRTRRWQFPSLFGRFSLHCHLDFIENHHG
ncbi:hypothetical protein LEMLEM_LOCUS6931, partial [Lemmus lemmus]